MPRSIAERADALPALAEVFREYGYEGASLSIISKATGLGKGSLYHFFPGGKGQMASAVLEEIGSWFEFNIFTPLRADADPSRAIADMFEAVESYFHSGRRVCLVGAIALNNSRDQFATAVARYFREWIKALSQALTNAGIEKAADMAEEIVAGIQGGIVLARAMNKPAIFARRLKALENSVNARSTTVGTRNRPTRR